MRLSPALAQLPNRTRAQSDRASSIGVLGPSHRPLGAIVRALGVPEVCLHAPDDSVVVDLVPGFVQQPPRVDNLLVRRLVVHAEHLIGDVYCVRFGAGPGERGQRLNADGVVIE
ncbi:hypothetical protein [Halosimplex sp. J119]